MRVAMVITFALACGAAHAGEPKTPEELLAWVEDGYRDADPAHLDVFLEEWRGAAPPTAEDVIAKKPDFERALYEAFPAFFTPAVEPEQWVVCPSEIEVCLVNGDVAEILRGGPGPLLLEKFEPHVVSRFTVHDFRPRLNVPAAKLVYADDRFVVPLLAFLARQKPFHPVERFWEMKNTGAELRARLEYVRNRLPVYAGHWGQGWHVATCPIPEQVYMDLEMTEMVIPYRRGYGGGEAVLEKEDGRWTSSDEGIRWIE